jgi:Glycosyltransferase family 87
MQHDAVTSKSLLVHVAEVLLLGVLPILTVVLALWAYAGDDRLALDFHHELYRQAEAVVDGRDAYEAPDADLSDRSNFLWPMAAVLPVVPLTALPPGLADWLATAAVIATLVAALWILGVRDWRVYGVVAFWPSVIEGIQTANASLPLTLLVATMWRYRDRAPIAGVALGYGIAVKLFLWPLVVWLALVGRRRAAAVAIVTAAASLLLLLPFTSLVDYVRLLRNLAETFEHEAYTPFALLTDIGVPDALARGVTVALGLAVLALAWRRRSLGLAIAAALVLSPIVWRHFFVLLAVPLALSRPRFDVVWLIPIGLWVGDGTFNGAPWQTACVLALVALTFLVSERSGPERDSSAESVPTPVAA